MKKYFMGTAAPSFLHQRVHQAAPDSLTPPLGQNRHAAYAGPVALHKQTCGSRHRVIGVSCQHVYRVRIIAIPLQYFGDTLLTNEDRGSDSAQQLLRLCPCHDACIAHRVARCWQLRH